MPSLERFIDMPGVVRILEGNPFLSQTIAHAFLILGVMKDDPRLRASVR
jgi:hypothetical protein